MNILRWIRDFPWAYYHVTRRWEFGDCDRQYARRRNILTGAIQEYDGKQFDWVHVDWDVKEYKRDEKRGADETR